MKRMLCCVLAILAGTAGAAAGQEGSAGGPMTYALARKANYVPLETLRETRSRIPAPLARQVTIARSGVLLQQVLLDIANQAELGLSYGEDLVRARVVVSLSAKAETAADALQQVTDGTDWAVLVTPTGQVAVLRREPAQVGTIAGSVTDAKTGTALGGATIVAEGTSLSATTGSDGHYRLGNVSPGKYTLRARFIGYAPGLTAVTVSADQEATADIALQKSVQRLDEAVTTGTVVPTELKASPSPVTIVTGQQLEEQNMLRVDQIFRGTVPGAIAWDQGTNNLYSYIAVRGSSSSLFGTPYVKTYIDGVEVTDPTYIATIDPRSVERVELVRGPQASTIYGSDASGGVMQIFTKKGTATGVPELSATALVGVMEGPFAVGTPVRQDYSLRVSGGQPAFSYSLGGSYLYSGAVAPGYWSRTPNLSAGASVTQGPVSAELSLRYSRMAYSYVNNPVLATIPYFSKPAYEEFGLPQETYGANVTYHATPRWRHNLILGVDRMTYQDAVTRPRFTTPSDSLLRSLDVYESKASIRYNTSYDVPLGATTSLAVTAGADYFQYNYDQFIGFDQTQTTGVLDGTVLGTKTPYANSGYFGQAQLGLRDRLFLTGGLRAERSGNFGNDYGTAWSPRAGVSYIQPAGGVSLKVHGSYGDAIRGADPLRKTGSVTAFQIQLANPGLAPERQSGWDAGVDLYWGSRASFSVTHYDQTAKDLIDGVTIGTTIPQTTQYQNVGRVKNRGWEFEGQLALGRVDLHATYSSMVSTVQQLSSTYTGDYRIGDQLNAIPRSSAGATMRWGPFEGTNAVLGMTYLGHWSNYDWQAYYMAIFGLTPFRASGRDYVIQYPSVTKLTLSLSQRLVPRVTALLQVDNLGNNGRYEAWNLNTPVGRVTSVGVRMDY
jgi:outer membrane receptor protein involved in Fe transport